MSDEIKFKPSVASCPFCGSRIVGGQTFCSQLLGFDRNEDGGLEVACDSFGHYWVQCTQDYDLDDRSIVACCVGPKVNGPMNPGGNTGKTIIAANKAINAWNKRAAAIQERLDV